MDDQERRNEQDSYYSYSYVRDGGNENTTWRADENTSSGTNNYNYYQAGNGHAQYDAPKEKRGFFHRQSHQGNSQGPTSFSKKLARAAALGLVFGLVAGGVFVGTGYAGMKALGIDNRAATQADEGKESVEATKVTGISTSKDADSTTTKETVSAIVEEVMPSIVSITNLSVVQGRDFFGRAYSDESKSAGSGIIIEQDKDNLYIATNNHVVDGAETLSVAFCDDQTATAEIKGTYSTKDLAVVAVPLSSISDSTMSAIKVATLGDSDSMKVGDTTVAIGNALGYGQSVTSGIISALEREVSLQDESDGSIISNKLIQTDAAINEGNSGGALLNIKGEVIGINSAKYSGVGVEGMGYAIPISQAKPIINSLIHDEKVDEEESGYLGIQGADIEADVASTYGMPRGLYVTMVVEGSAAEKAGIKKGDIITALDDKEITSMEGLREALSYCKAGSEVNLTIQSQVDGNYQEEVVPVKLGERPAQ